MKKQFLRTSSFMDFDLCQIITFEPENHNKYGYVRRFYGNDGQIEGDPGKS
ncbi:hypothetical protein SAMN06265377_1586 [Flagellimonas pacifica]|uniref:Uncharacterized protein n=1 Tax=Flagellimonas pacifica TaxID=1247520 RepID=A0A285MRG9_9FLAO|nr:hypothetical protein SAMN06265377_1586 [Allomuricauda parva]